MHAIRLLAFAAVPCAAAIAVSPAIAGGKCSQQTTIHNDSGITLRFVELKSAVTPPTLFKSQWTGEKDIAPGASATINWTSDFACTNNGVANHWDVKFFRKDGTEHRCGGLSQSQDVRVDTPDLCFGL